ncbi:hypothetical protein GCM10010485_12850 [Streptosporangium carneum]
MQPLQIHLHHDLAGVGDQNRQGLTEVDDIGVSHGVLLAEARPAKHGDDVARVTDLIRFNSKHRGHEDAHLVAKLSTFPETGHSGASPTDPVS